MANTTRARMTPIRELTTPLQQKESIGTARTSAARIEIQLQGPSRSPFVQYPVTSQVTIAARCTFDDKGKAPIALRARFDPGGAPSRVQIPLSGEQAAALAAVEVFAEPYGHAALLDAQNGELALGRLRFERPLRGGGQNHALCRVHVVASVVAFIVAEMNKNVGDPDVSSCRRENERARELEIEAEKYYRKAQKEGPLGRVMAARVGSDLLDAAAAQRAAAKARLGYRAHTDSGFMGYLPGGDWDHKPRIAAVWGSWNRLGDSEKVYYHDIWSNLHFGYIGHAAGFTLEELLGGADVQQQVDHGADDESADKNSIREGYHLYDPKPGATVTVERVLAVVAAHEDWLRAEREKQWKAAKQKK
ncbi:polymorphic toxin type 44 domain-containing protein [Sorangium sp. So ce118]